jgi:hypothetical protein
MNRANARFTPAPLMVAEHNAFATPAPNPPPPVATVRAFLHNQVPQRKSSARACCDAQLRAAAPVLRAAKPPRRLSSVMNSRAS